ncbi:MAG: AAA family ATPase [Bacteriovoracia bacterium]
MTDVAALNDKVRAQSKFIDDLESEVGKVVVGQKLMVERILMALLCDGHILLEGLPGLAKTLTIKTVADVIHIDFQRIQFTPDLLPADLIGTVIYNQKTGEFTPKLGPIHSNIILADEINRAPAKVQSALLEAMAEKQVTIADQTYKLKSPFIVLATQNPIEQEGTYPLPEAQMDRFMFKVKVSYPTIQEEKTILDRMSMHSSPRAEKVIEPNVVAQAKELVTQIYMDEKIKDYILSIVFASRYPERFGMADLKGMIQVGASPRASIYLAKGARACAFLAHRGFVTPEDIKTIAYDILRHRIMVTYEAEANDITSESVIKRILDKIEVP